MTKITPCRSRPAVLAVRAVVPLAAGRLHARAGEDDAGHAAARHAGAAAARRRAERSRKRRRRCRSSPSRRATRRRGRVRRPPPRAANEPPQARAARSPNRRRPSRRSRPKSRPSRRPRCRRRPATAEGEVERGIRAIAAARDDRSQPDRLPRAQRRRAHPVRHRAKRFVSRPEDAIRARRTCVVLRKNHRRQSGTLGRAPDVIAAPAEGSACLTDSSPRDGCRSAACQLHRRQHLASALKERHNMWCLHA